MASTAQTVVEAVVTKLAAVVAGTVYEPGSANVVAMDMPPDMSNVGGDTFYTVIPRLEPDQAEARGLPDSGTLTGRLPMEVLAFRRAPAAGTALQDAGRWRIACDVATDIEQKLIAAENARDGLGPIVTYLDGDMTWASDWTDQWVIVRFRFAVRYRKSRTTR